LTGSEHEFIASSRIRRNIAVLANLQLITASALAVIRCFLHAPHPRNSSVSAAITMALADNLLQKQREQGRSGNPALHSGDVEMDRGFGRGDWSTGDALFKSRRAPRAR
jgi:hypothetical protein